MLEEMLAAQATIKAAELQAEATMWAAAIGGSGIVIGLLISWWTALHLQKVARIAETRRNVYLELVEAYSNMVSGFYTIGFDIEKNWKLQTTLILNFSKAIDKTTFVCKTETKSEIYKLLKIFKEKYLLINGEMNSVLETLGELNDLTSRHEQIMSRFDEALATLEIIKREGRDDEKTNHILKYFDEKTDESELCIPLITEKAKELDAKKTPMQLSIVEFVDELNDLILPITHMLRKELGAKTDVSLDLKLHLSAKEI